MNNATNESIGSFRSSKAASQMCDRASNLSHHINNINNYSMPPPPPTTANTISMIGEEAKSPTGSSAKSANILTTRSYVNRLSAIQAFSTGIAFLVVLTEMVAIATNDWFVLNLNEYIPTSKGGLFFYCFMANSPNAGFYGQYTGQYTCVKYEDLPNFAIFVNSLLYDSRILMLCACGFSGLILILELFGLFCLCCVETKNDQLDRYLMSLSERNNRSTAAPHDLNFGTNMMLSNSARFTNSIVSNNGMSSPDQTTKIAMARLRPVGYFTYCTCSVIGVVGSLLEIILKISGFVLFNTYLANLLTLNTVFLAYRSYSFWFMVASILLSVLYWLFKALTVNHVMKLTKTLVGQREKLLPYYYNSTNTIKTDLPFEQYNRLRDFVNISEMPRELIIEHSNRELMALGDASNCRSCHTPLNQAIMTTTASVIKPGIRTSFVYELESSSSGDDATGDLNTSMYPSRAPSPTSSAYRPAPLTVASSYDPHRHHHLNSNTSLSNPKTRTTNVGNNYDTESIDSTLSSVRF